MVRAVKLDIAKLVEKAQAFQDSVDEFHSEKAPEKPPVGKIQVPVFENTFKFEKWPAMERDLRAEFLTFVETFYWNHRKLPVRADFQDAFSERDLPKDVEGWKQLLAGLQDSLANRGIPAFWEPEQSLEAKFVLAVNLICSQHDKLSLPAKLKQAGLTPAKFKGMLRQEKYLKYYQARVNEIYDEELEIDKKLALSRLVADGDLAAIKYADELRNVYRPQQSANQMMLVMLQTLLEIIKRHVTPDVLNTIAGEIQTAQIIDIPVGELNEAISP